MPSSKPTTDNTLVKESIEQFKKAAAQLKTWMESTTHRYSVNTKQQLDACIQKLLLEAVRCFNHRVANTRSFFKDKEPNEEFLGKDWLNEMTENLKQTLTILDNPCPNNIKNYLERAEKAPGIYISEANKRNYERVQRVLTTIVIVAFLATWPTLFFCLPAGILVFCGMCILVMSVIALGESWGRQIQEGSKGMAAKMNDIVKEVTSTNQFFNNRNQSVTNQLTPLLISEGENNILNN